MAEATPEETFEPLWLFHPNNPSGVLIETQEVYDELMRQGGWVDTPAKFGVFTAPNVEQQLLQAASLRPVPPPVVPSVGPAVGVLEVKVAALEATLADVREVLMGHEERLQALEAPEPTRTAQAEEKPPSPPVARQERK